MIRGLRFPGKKCIPLHALRQCLILYTMCRDFLAGRVNPCYDYRGSAQEEAGLGKKGSLQLASGYLVLGGVGIAVIVLVIGLVFFWRDRTAPSIRLSPDITVLGAKAAFTLTVSDPDSGLREVKATLRQGDLAKEILAQSFSRGSWLGGGETRQVEPTLTLEPGAWGFRDGPASLQITARDFSWGGFFQGHTARLTRDFRIDLVPLRISLRSVNNLINQGGTGLVVYQLNKAAALSGVAVNDRLFPGYPLPGKEGYYLAFFAVPYDASQPFNLELRAQDEGGQVVRERVVYRLKPQRWRRDRLNLSTDFFTKKMPEFQEIFPELRGLSDPLAVFLRVNRDMRQANHQKVLEICQQSSPGRLWQGAFLRLPNSKPMARFADHRTYVHDNREIDQQVHLGQDLASLLMAEIPAAAAGVVAFADPLGIYGKTVILDHGWGLFSMYSHLSQISVQTGQKLARGDILGRTGATGLAGGDHLHYSVMIAGTFVNPLEWWDPHWIKDQVERQLSLAEPPAVPSSPPASRPKRRR